MLKVTSGPYSGFVCNDLTELLDHQQATQEKCSHPNLQLTEGTRGKGFRKFHFTRHTCPICAACVYYVQTPNPDFDEQKRLDLQFLDGLKDCWVAFRKHPAYGWFPDWLISTRRLSFAKEEYANQDDKFRGVEGFPIKWRKF